MVNRPDNKDIKMKGLGITRIEYIKKMAIKEPEISTIVQEKLDYDSEQDRICEGLINIKLDE